MLRQINLVFILVFSMFAVFSATVDVNVNVKEDVSLFVYSLKFDENESYSSFSFEKPRDASIIAAKNSDGESLSYKVAGDYFIFTPEDTNGQNFEVVLKSKFLSEEVLSKNSFSTYVNFNFPVETLVFNLFFDGNFNEVQDRFPRDYEVSDTGEIIWTLENVEEDTFFLVNFEANSPNDFLQTNLVYLMIGLFVVILVLIIVSSFVFFKFRKTLVNGEVVKKEQKEEKEESEEEITEEKFEEFTAKYLTENEKEVVDVVKENEGISQYDILNYLPQLTKSNLSKIISKLNAKRILDRVKVGKINKIYLGEKLKNEEKSEKKDKDN